MLKATEEAPISAGFSSMRISNDGPTVDDEPMAAFGGVGDSGFWRFGGQDALREFTEPRWVKQWDRSQRQFPI